MGKEAHRHVPGYVLWEHGAESNSGPMVRSEKRACLSTVQTGRRTEGVMVRRNSIHKDIWGTVSQVRKLGSLGHLSPGQVSGSTAAEVVEGYCLWLAHGNEELAKWEKIL